MPREGDFDVRLQRLRALRAGIDELPDRFEILSAIRAEIEPTAHPPEPPGRHGRLIAEVVETLKDPSISPEQALELRAVFVDADA